jgi:hypothetical protein
MKIADYKKLDEKINGQDFNKSYKNINKTLYLLSIFGNLVSIFLAFFILSKILSSAINNLIIVYIISFILLSGLELLKRDIFDKFSVQYLKIKSFNKDVIPLLLFSILISSTSFFATISGAKELSSKQKVIQQEEKQIVSKFADSLTTIYNNKIITIDAEIKKNKEKLDAKDKEQTEIEAIQPISRASKNRVKDLKEEKNTIREDNTKLENDINNNKTELANKLKEHETEIGTETQSKKKDNNTNMIVFVLISTIVEFIILIGVYFNEYYKFRSHKEFSNKIEKDPNFQKWILYDKILNAIYSEDLKLNEKLPSGKSIIDICKINNIIINTKDVTTFFKLMNNLGIIKTSGSARYVNKQRDVAFELLRKQFNII